MIRYLLIMFALACATVMLTASDAQARQTSASKCCFGKPDSCDEQSCIESRDRFREMMDQHHRNNPPIGVSTPSLKDDVEELKRKVRDLEDK